MEETDTIAALLEKQVQSGVRWEVTVRRLAELGVDAAIEIGPGRALTGFVKKDCGKCYLVLSGGNCRAAATAAAHHERSLTMPQTENLRRAALVTGGAKGIGRAICRALAENGMNIAVNYAGSAAAAEETAAACRALGVQAVTLQADVRSPEACQKLVEDTVAAFGRIDVLVNNAGITADKLLLRMTEADFDNVLATNLKGAFFLHQSGLPLYDAPAVWAHHQRQQCCRSARQRGSGQLRSQQGGADRPDEKRCQKSMRPAISPPTLWLPVLLQQI